MDVVKGIGDGLTNSDVTQMVTNANQISLLIWAIVAIILVFSIALVVITKTFVSNSNKTNEGYKELMKQNADNITEFRKSVDNISEVLRTLSERVAVTDSYEEIENAKFQMMANRQELLKKEFSDSMTNFLDAIRQHERNSNSEFGKLSSNVKELTSEIKNLRLWCRDINSLGSKITEKGSDKDEAV